MPIAVKPTLLNLRDRSREFARHPKTHRWGRGILIFLLIFGLLGYFAAPPLIRSAAERQLGALLMRPVTITNISLNPYTLALEAKGVRIAEPDGATDFVTLGRLRVRPSWTSLFRAKPIIAEVLIDSLHVNLIRTERQRFNVSDIVDALSKPDETAKPAASKPVLFAVSNIRVENTRIDLDDRVLNEKHSVDKLRIGLPFVANIPSKVEVFVQPLLEATIDGSAFALTGQAKPFSPTLESSLAIKLDQLDLAGLLGYSPTALPVRIAKAKLSTDLLVQFERQGEESKIGISGTVDLGDVSLTDADSRPLFGATLIHLAADSIEPLKQIAHLSELRIEQPVVTLSRNAQGQLNLSQLAGTPASAARPVEKPASKATAPETKSAEAALPDISLSSLKLVGGAVHLDDLSIGGKGAQLDLRDIELAAKALSTRATTPATYELKARLVQGGALAVEGSAVVPERKVEAKLTLDALSLPVFQPWLASSVAARLSSGTLGIQMQAQVDAHDSASPLVQIGPGAITLQSVKLIGDRKKLAAIDLGRATLTLGAVDLATHHAEVTRLDIDALNVNAERAADGSIDLASLVKSGKTTAAGPPTGSKPQPWTYHVGSAALGNSGLVFVDGTHADPVSVRISGLAFKASNLSEDATKPIPLELSGTLQKKGKFAILGTVTQEPLQAALSLKGSDLDVATFAPYLAAGYNVAIASAMLNFSGNARFSRVADVVKGGYKGDLSLDNLRVLDRLSSDAFLGFRSLGLTRMDAHYDAVAGTDVEIGGISLSNFFAQVLLDAEGKLNVGRVIGGTAAPSPAAATVPAEGPAVVTAAIAIPTKTAPANPHAPASPPLRLHIGGITLSGGAVDYTDNFIKPNFTANLTDIAGSIGAFGTASTDSAPVDVKARLNSSGPVRISGAVNPLATTPALDIKADASEIELTRFAAYSIKYTGYPIIKGKLQVDLNYVLKDNQLKANNHIYIDQFTFGEHVDSPGATSLPVRLAISLLKNSRGEIDINVPVSGSLSDPEFSIGGVIWHAFLNVIEKAVTSPFSLLASAFDGGAGGDDLGIVAFAPGSAVLDDAQKAKLDKLAKALSDKPAVKIDLNGHADAVLDTPALKTAALMRQVRQQKLKDLVGKGESVDVDSISIEPGDYEKYLTRAYSSADLKKPRNAIGIAKTQTPDEMQALITNATVITDSDLVALAERRATAVQQWLDGKVDAGRIFVVAPKLGPIEKNDGGPTTRVDFQLRD